MKRIYITVGAVIVAILVLALAVWAIQGGSEDTNPSDETAVEEEHEDSEPADLEEEGTEDGSEIHEVRYDGSFNPDEITINEGDIVIFHNDSDSDIWVASDEHPTHEELPGFDSESNMVPGNEYSYVFEETGTWGYHDHLDPSQTGTVIVE